MLLEETMRRESAMSVLESHVNPREAGFEDNAATMRGLVADLRTRLAEAQAGGGPEAVARHRSRNKLTARERIDRLVDPGSAFLEFSALAANGMYDGASPSAGIVTGMGRV